VLRDDRPCDLEAWRDLAGRQLSAGDELQDAPAVRLGDRRSTGSIAAVTELSAAARKLFEEPNLLFVGTVNRDGSPQVTPVWTHLENGYITFNTAVGRAKERNMRRDPRVGLSISAREDPMDKVDVIGRVVDMIEGEPADGQIDDLSEKYIGQRPYPWRRGETRVKVLIEPVRVYQM
jgi:PPOX class probable F420-dependent enzyme